MNEPPPVPSTVEYKDRRGGLIGLGILSVIIGCVWALFVPLMLFSITMASRATGRATDARAMIPAVVLYSVLASMFIWLGIGSMMCRRWARALLLVLSWGWLLTGVLVMGAMAVFLPRIFAHAPSGGQSLPESARLITTIAMLGFFGVVFVILPGLLLLFYRSRHVKATCEARDPVVRWTDACPLPVLALSLMLGFGAVSMLPMALVYHGVTPVFGRLVSGMPGTTLMLVMTALWCYCTWATYKLKVAGWWTAFIAHVVFMVSAAVTYAQVDLMEVYRKMGYPEERVEQIQKYSFFQGHNMVWFIVIAAVPLIGYLLFVKRYFRRAV